MRDLAAARIAAGHEARVLTATPLDALSAAVRPDAVHVHAGVVLPFASDGEQVRPPFGWAHTLGAADELFTRARALRGMVE